MRGNALLQLQLLGGHDLPLTRRLWPFQTNSSRGLPTGTQELRSPGDVGAVVRLGEGSSTPISEGDKEEEIQHAAVSGTFCGDQSPATQLCFEDMKSTREACATGSHLACEPTTTGSLLANTPLESVSDVVWVLLVAGQTKTSTNLILT